MYRNAFQGKFVTVFYSCGSNPLDIWETHTKNGYISRFMDPELKSLVLEIGGSNVSTTYMVCPKGKKVLGITMPFLIMIVKNMKKYFSFEVTILDETGTRRRFRVSNFQSSTSIQPLSTAMPIGLSDGWNQILFNLSEFTNRAYKKQFVEVQKIKINANIRLRRIYFSACLFPEEELPKEYKLYFPIAKGGKRNKSSDSIKEKENEALINAEPIVDQSTPLVEPPLPMNEEEKPEESIKPPSRTSIKTSPSRESQESKQASATQITEKQVSQGFAKEIHVEETEPTEKISETVVENQAVEMTTEEFKEDKNDIQIEKTASSLVEVPPTELTKVVQINETIPSETDKQVEDAAGTETLTETEPPEIADIPTETVALTEKFTDET